MGKRDHQPYKLHARALMSLPDGEHADGANLYLRVRGNSRTWVVRYVSTNGSRTRMGLGSLQIVTLSDARTKAREIIAKLRNPLKPTDPIIERKAIKAAQRLAQAKQITFMQCATALIEAKSHGWRNGKHTAQWSTTLKKHAYPILGNLPVSSIDTTLVMKCLDLIWLKTNETARRLQGRIAAVLDWATAHGYREGDNPARWKGHLDKLLADPNKVQKRKHFAALPYQEIAVFMKALRKCQGIGAIALEFTILTAARSGEVRGAKWSEIDLAQATWTIPAVRMKTGKDHRVPLSKRAIRLLTDLPIIDSNPFVFPSARNRSLSDTALTGVLKRLGRKNVTVHGFRSSFRDWAAECTSFSRDVAEMALAHSISNSVEAAYRRGDLYLKRQLLMAEWADYCDKVQEQPAKVLSIQRNAINAN